MGMMKRRLESRPSNLSTWKEVDDAGYVIVGSPETVRQRLEDYAEKVGFGLLIANFSVGNAPREYTEKSMKLFADQVTAQSPARKIPFGTFVVNESQWGRVWFKEELPLVPGNGSIKRAN